MRRNLSQCKHKVIFLRGAFKGLPHSVQRRWELRSSAVTVPVARQAGGTDLRARLNVVAPPRSKQAESTVTLPGDTLEPMLPDRRTQLGACCEFSSESRVTPPPVASRPPCEAKCESGATNSGQRGSTRVGARAGAGDWRTETQRFSRERTIGNHVRTRVSIEELCSLNPCRPACTRAMPAL